MESYKINVDKEALKRTSEMLGVRVCDLIKNNHASGKISCMHATICAEISINISVCLSSGGVRLFKGEL